MFSFNYKFKVNPTKPNVIKLTPTLGTYVKAFGPTVVLFGGLALIGAYAEWKEARDKKNVKRNGTTTAN